METFVLTPIALLGWWLSKKVLDQQHIIHSQEETIHTQQEILEYIRHRQRHSSAVVTVGIGFLLVAGYYRYCQYNAAAQRLTAASTAVTTPPETYVPTVATTDSEACVLCLHYRRDSLLQPCHHLATCWECTQRLREQFGDPLCPMCRTPVSGAEYVYVP